MRMTVTIEMDNAAFFDGMGEDPAGERYAGGEEAARILRSVADRLDGAYSAEDAGQIDQCRDANGNTVGEVVLSA